MKKITRIDLENILTHIPDKKLHSLKSFLEKKKILKPNDIFTIKSKLKLTSEEFAYVKKTLEKVSDIEAFLMNLELLAELERERDEFSENVRLVWSGPIFNEMADNTAPVIHEMVNSAKKTITIIGYWLWDEGNVEEIIEALMVAAKKRNVKIRIIFNEADKKKRVGKKRKLTIKEYFMQYWKNIIAFPRIYTYNGKIHAKAWVVDSNQILITSANLTDPALERNLELGIRCKGSIAKNVDEIIDGLIEQKYIKEV